MFENVFGHERNKELLGRMAKRDQLHHGLCFFGPAGIGKRLMAQELAKIMLCEDRSGCGRCKHCTKLANGNHPDYREIHPDGSNIKVDQIREISENLHFRPFEGRVRMIVLDQVESFREEAANAFLKSLEEPPDYVYFILVTSDVKALLPTIQSRCQKIGFQSLTPADKKNILINRFEKHETMAERLASISFRRLETDEEAWNLFCRDLKKILQFYQLMAKEGHAMDLFSELVRDKSALERFLDHLMATTREITMVAKGVPASPLFNDFREDIAALAARFPADAWRKAWEELTRLAGKRQVNVNLSLFFNAFSVTALNLVQNEERILKQRLSRGR